MSAITHIASNTLDRAIFGGEPERPLNDMSVEELEARFHTMNERQKVLWWSGFAVGLGGGAFAGLKIVALAAL